LEGRGAITIRDLVRNALRMRPDRIVVGECRGGEALDMLQAMNTGHDGSLTTIHANTARDALARLETLVLMAGFDLPLRAIREQIASAIHLVVQITRERDGSRKIINISEITQMEGDIITMQDIFTFNQTGWSEDNRILGEYLPTGNIPTFMEDIQRAKLDLDISLFNQER
jgi:pilus assembly protein CpaF